MEDKLKEEVIEIGPSQLLFRLDSIDELENVDCLIGVECWGVKPGIPVLKLGTPSTH
jgi:hypothetical protein